MKKVVKGLLMLVLVLSLALSAGQSVAKAVPPPEPVEVIGWDTFGVIGNEINMTLVPSGAPDWLQLLSNGLNLTAPSKICYPFRGGQFGWTAEIRMFDGSKWIKLPTTADWTKDNEGKIWACANAPAAGLYALYGYYTKPTVIDNTVDCNLVRRNTDAYVYEGVAGYSGYEMYELWVNPVLFPHALVVVQYFNILPENSMPRPSTNGLTTDDGFFGTGWIGGFDEVSSYDFMLTVNGCQIANINLGEFLT